MQIKIFTIPLLGGEMLIEEMNVFLRSKKILQIREHLSSQPVEGTFWCFCIKYVDDIEATDRERNRVDYREVLDEETFKKFSALREIRKRVAKEDAVPAFAVFTDFELSEMAKLENISAESLKTVKGIGEKKVTKYGAQFYSKTEDAPGQ
jgi:superfamily II DNA helicase RecQ